MQLGCGCCSPQVPAPAQPSGRCPSWLSAAFLLPAAAVTACPGEKHPQGWLPTAEEEGSSHLPWLQPCTQPVPHTLSSKPSSYPESKRGKTAGIWSPLQGSTLDLPTWHGCSSLFPMAFGKQLCHGALPACSLPPCNSEPECWQWGGTPSPCTITSADDSTAWCSIATVRCRGNSVMAGCCLASVYPLLLPHTGFTGLDLQRFSPRAVGILQCPGLGCMGTAVTGSASSQAEVDKEPFTWRSDPNLVYLSAGTKVYNLCHRLNESWAKQWLSPFPEPAQSPSRQRQKI